jgi:hypothetical protein
MWLLRRNSCVCLLKGSWFKQPKEGTKISKRYWRLCGDERTQSKLSVFSETKDAMVMDMTRSTSFNGDVSYWNIPKVRSMSHMFYGASSFDQDLCLWDVSPSTYTKCMFSSEPVFNTSSCWEIDPPVCL